MGVAAAIDCLRGIDRDTIDAVLFASTSYPFKEKQGAAIVAKALDLRRDVYTSYVGDTLRAGTNALRTAADAVKAGSAKRVLVVASDVRMAAPRTGLEANIGDGAAAFLIGTDDVALTIDAAHAITDEIVDVWRTEGDAFVHSWEDRFVVDHGYRACVREAVRGLLEKTGLAPKDFATLVLYGPDARAHATTVRDLGFEAKTQVQDPLFGKVGNAGAALAPLLLAAAIEGAKAGQRVLLVGYGYGADALALTATPHVERLEGRRGVGWHLARRADLGSYDLYLRFRQLLATEHDRRAGAGLSATKHFRDRDADVSLLGQQPPLRSGAVPRESGFTAMRRTASTRSGCPIGWAPVVVHLDNFAAVESADGGHHRGWRAPYVQMTDVSPKKSSRHAGQ
jgi:3-hydroxy-3-methylglutaryl CoA synthase